MSRHFSLPLLAIVAALLTGCAAQAPSAPSLSEPEILRLKSGQEELARRLERLQDNLVLVEARVEDQQKLIVELQEQVAQKVTLPREKAGAAVPVPLPAGRSIAEPSQPPPREIYLQAFADYATGRFQRALTGFENFLRVFPDNEFAGNARFWLGECYFSLEKFDQAATEFRRVAEEFPQGEKAPAALLREAASLRQAGKVEAAAQALTDLRNRYPESAAARKSQGGE